MNQKPILKLLLAFLLWELYIPVKTECILRVANRNYPEKLKLRH